MRSTRRSTEHAAEIERFLDRVRLLRTEHTKAVKAIAQANRHVDDLAAGIAAEVDGIQAHVDCLVAWEDAEHAA